MAQHLFEGLYRFDDDSATVPALAKDVKISDDGRKYHLAPWHYHHQTDKGLQINVVPL
jgi:ABC-type transport system substrate-binding protein